MHVQNLPSYFKVYLAGGNIAYMLIRNDRLPDKKIKELPDTYKYHLVIVNFL
jgi:hypothetical protein